MMRELFNWLVTTPKLAVPNVVSGGPNLTVWSRSSTCNADSKRTLNSSLETVVNQRRMTLAGCRPDPKRGSDSWRPASQQFLQPHRAVCSLVTVLDNDGRVEG